MWHGQSFIWRVKKFLMWSFKIVNSWCTLMVTLESGSTSRTSKNYLSLNIRNCNSFFLIIPKITEKSIENDSFFSIIVWQSCFSFQFFVCDINGNVYLFSFIYVSYYIEVLSCIRMISSSYAIFYYQKTWLKTECCT